MHVTNPTSSTHTTDRQAGKGRIGLFLLAFGLFYYLFHLGSATVELEMAVKNKGFMQLFWAYPATMFSADRVVSRNTRPDIERYRMSLGHFTFADKLRIDPAIRPGKVTITRLRLSAGPFTILDLDDPDELLARINADQAEVIPNPAGPGAVVRLHGSDPKLEINLRDEQVRRLLTRELPVIVLLLTLFYLARRHWLPWLQIAPGQPALGHAGSRWIALTVTLAALEFFRPGHPYLPLTVATSLLLAIGSVRLLAALLRQPGRLPLPRKMADGTLVAGFLLLVALPAYQLLFTDPTTSQAGEAVSDDEPATAVADETGLRGLEARLEDGLRYRRELLYLNALASIYVFDYSPVRKVLKGRNGFYFEGIGERKVTRGVIRTYDSLKDYAGLDPLSDAELLQWKEMLEGRRDWFAARGTPYLFVLAPTKAQIYPEYLPESFRRLRAQTGGSSRHDQLMTYLKANSDVPIVDLKSALLRAKETMPEGQYLYYRTDFHWNFLGAFHAYQAIVDALNMHYPGLRLERLDLEQFRIDADPGWVHARFMGMLGLIPQYHMDETYYRLAALPGNPLAGLKDVPDGKVQDTILPLRPLTSTDGTKGEGEYAVNPAAQRGSIYLVGDSFIEKLVLLFSAHARRTHYERGIIHFSNQIFDYDPPDIVIHEVLDMYIL